MAKLIRLNCSCRLQSSRTCDSLSRLLDHQPSILLSHCVPAELCTSPQSKSPRRYRAKSQMWQKMFPLCLLLTFVRSRSSSEKSCLSKGLCWPLQGAKAERGHAAGLIVGDKGDSNCHWAHSGMVAFRAKIHSASPCDRQKPFCIGISQRLITASLLSNHVFYR